MFMISFDQNTSARGFAFSSRSFCGRPIERCALDLALVEHGVPGSCS